MTIGVLKSNKESLVSLVPKVVGKLIVDKTRVLIEEGSGLKSNFKDESYREAGAEIVSRKSILEESDIILTFSEIEKDELSVIPSETFLIGKFRTGSNPELLESFKNNRTKVFNLDLLPRSTIAQSMDVLSALASLSGYKAVIMAADQYQGYMSMMTTSAGTVPPARVLVVGAGVAGLQAIATARRLGAIVQAFDVRNSVREEVESLGAKFVEVEGAQDDTNAGGYAVQQSEEFIEKQKELIHHTALKSDIIITSANIPNKKAPLLIEKRTVEAMKDGSVIIDMATESGGNVALSRDDETIEINGVTIIGDSKLYNKLGSQASEFYANNIYNFIQFVFSEGLEKIPYDNEIVSETLLHLKKDFVNVN